MLDKTHYVNNERAFRRPERYDLQVIRRFRTPRAISSRGSSRAKAFRDRRGQRRAVVPVLDVAAASATTTRRFWSGCARRPGSARSRRRRAGDLQSASRNGSSGRKPTVALSWSCSSASRCEAGRRGSSRSGGAQSRSGGSSDADRVARAAPLRRQLVAARSFGAGPGGARTRAELLRGTQRLPARLPVCGEFVQPRSFAHRLDGSPSSGRSSAAGDACARRSVSAT